jgi:DnaK suppressor protein
MNLFEMQTLKANLETKLQELEATLSRVTALESAAGIADENDKATWETERAIAIRMRDRDRKLAGKVREALVKIENGSYGLCESCDEPIGVRRLLARPVTSRCIDCKAELEAEERRARFNDLPTADVTAAA